jgi:CrcB protein
VTPPETPIPGHGRRVWYEHRVQVVDRSHPFAPAVVGAIAVGGAIGAASRWGAAELVDAIGSPHVAATWPWATLLVNVVGCLLIGLAARTLTRDTVAWAFAVTGVLGGFTTFSALAVELNDLADADRLPMAVLYGAVTLAAGIGATFLAHRPMEVGE